MTDLATLDPETRAYALVGRFLHKWAIMEFVLHKVIAKAMGLDKPQMIILAVNMDFVKKVYVARSTVSMSILDAGEKKHFDSVLVELEKLANTRNVIAHCSFGPMAKGDGVTFNYYKAKSKFEVPDWDWSIADFDAADEKLNGICHELDALEGKLANSALVKALLESRAKQPPMFGGLFGLGDAYLVHGPGLLSEYLGATAEQRSDEK